MREEYEAINFTLAELLGEVNPHSQSGKCLTLSTREGRSLG